jgi:hypothetical protein
VPWSLQMMAPKPASRALGPMISSRCIVKRTREHFLSEYPRSLNPTHPRHRPIQHNEIRFQFPCLLYGVPPINGLAADVETAIVFKSQPGGRPPSRIVVHDQDAFGHQSVTVTTTSVSFRGAPLPYVFAGKSETGPLYTSGKPLPCGCYKRCGCYQTVGREVSREIYEPPR